MSCCILRLRGMFWATVMDRGWSIRSSPACVRAGVVSDRVRPCNAQAHPQCLVAFLLCHSASTEFNPITCIVGETLVLDVSARPKDIPRR